MSRVVGEDFFFFLGLLAHRYVAAVETVEPIVENIDVVVGDVGQVREDGIVLHGILAPAAFEVLLVAHGDRLEHHLEVVGGGVVVAELGSELEGSRALDQRKLVRLREHVDNLVPGGGDVHEARHVHRRHLDEFHVRRNIFRENSFGIALFDFHGGQQIPNEVHSALGRRQHLDVSADFSVGVGVRAMAVHDRRVRAVLDDSRRSESYFRGSSEVHDF